MRRPGRRSAAGSRLGFRGGSRSTGESEDAEPSPVELAKLRAAARNTAIGLLARRDHAQAEIRRKLRERGVDGDLIGEVVDELTRQRLLSDDRFAEVFIRSRAERGQGPVRLRAELRQLQLGTEQIERHLQAAEVDWMSLARMVRERKFGSRPAGSLAERAKEVRFLQYRGFTAAQIRAAMGNRCEDDLLESDERELPDPEPEN